MKVTYFLSFLTLAFAAPVFAQEAPAAAPDRKGFSLCIAVCNTGCAVGCRCGSCFAICRKLFTLRLDRYRFANRVVAQQCNQGKWKGCW